MPDHPRVFISYSHDSDAHKAWVRTLAQTLRSQGVVAILDQFFSAQIVDWPRWCNEQTEQADFIVCVCTAEYRRRIEGKVPPERGKGVYWEGALLDDELYDAKVNSRLIPVLPSAEATTSIPRFLRGWTHCRIEAFELADGGYDLLYRIVTGQAHVEPAPIGALVTLPTERHTGSPAAAVSAVGSTPPTPAAPVAVELAHLPKAAADFLGRSTELATLDAAWADTGTDALVLVAPGGTGKSSLVRRWLDCVKREHWRGAQQVFGWSFYSQGSDDSRQASEDPFFAAALSFFGLTLAETASVHDKAAAIAKAMRTRRTLLILDGLEPLQYPPGPMGGQLKAKGIEALLQALIDSGHPGLCVVTTREALTDLAGHVRTADSPHGSVQQIDLGNLCAADGARLLHKLGVTRAGAAEIGSDDGELRKASETVQGHALTLRILGLYLRNACHGDVRRIGEVDFAAADREFQTDPERPYGHAFAAMRAYARWLAGGNERNRRQLAVLTLLGLFDRPATPDCLRALREPAIAGLTDGLAGIGDGEWNLLVADLEKAGLVQTAAWQPGKVKGYDDREMAERWMEAKSKYEDWLLDPPQPFTPSGPPLPAGARSLDAHPLLREYFARRLSDSKDPAEREAARAGHARLYEHLCASVPYWPEGEAGLAPLYQAVAHGCRAGRYQEACVEVYRDRINRRAEFYATYKLGLYGTELAALAGFFAPPWQTPVTALAEGDRAWLLNEAAFDLRALGRLREAVEPMRAGLEMRVVQQDWQQAAPSASNLSELLLTLGEVRQAEAEAVRAVGYADDSGDAFQRMAFRTAHAEAGLQAGAPAAALARFAEAEALQRQRQPEYPRLYSLQGFYYCDALLLGAERAAWAAWLGAALPGALCAARLAEAQAVTQRAAQTLAWGERANFPLDIGLDHLTLVRAALYRAWLATPGEAGAAASADTEATHAAAQAVEWLRKAGTDDHIPRGLLTRACVHALHSDAPAARADLDEAERIARRGDMQLFLADVHLHRARLFPDSDPAAARTDLAEARRLIDATGYERRRGELDDATAVLEGRAVELPETESVLVAIRGENLPEPPELPPRPEMDFKAAFEKLLENMGAEEKEKLRQLLEALKQNGSP